MTGGACPDWGERHLTAAVCALHRFRPQVDVAIGWGARLADVLADGGQLLAVGDGGSAAQAQHLVAELIRRWPAGRRPPAAAALSADSPGLAEGAGGDVLIALSGSARCAASAAVAERARRLGLAVWALTGPPPNQLAAHADEAITVAAATATTVREVHQVAVHLICAAVDQALAGPTVASLANGRPPAGRPLRA